MKELEQHNAQNAPHEEGILTGRLHSIETMGTVDGPGIRVVLFFQGCPLRCQYCHNRDTWTVIGGQERTVEELTKFILRYRSYICASGGGVTATGGEPLLQHRFITELFRSLKGYDIHTALDTSGFCALEEVKPLLEVTDLVILDVKAMDVSLHRRLTGVPNEKILAFARYLSERHIPTWIRHVLIPGLTDSEEELLALRSLILTLQNVERVELLPYHTLGVYKWEQMGCDYALAGVPAATPEDIKRARNVLDLDAGLMV